MNNEIFFAILKELPFIAIGILFIIWILRFHRDEREVRDKEWREWLQAVTFKFEVFLKEERAQFLHSVNEVSSKLTVHDLNVGKVREDILTKVSNLEDNMESKIRHLEDTIIFDKEKRKEKNGF